MLSELSADLGALDATARDAYTTIYAGDATLSMEIVGGTAATVSVAIPGWTPAFMATVFFGMGGVGMTSWGVGDSPTPFDRSGKALGQLSKPLKDLLGHRVLHLALRTLDVDEEFWYHTFQHLKNYYHPAGGFSLVYTPGETQGIWQDLVDLLYRTIEKSLVAPRLAPRGGGREPAERGRLRGEDARLQRVVPRARRPPVRRIAIGPPPGGGRRARDVGGARDPRRRPPGLSQNGLIFLRKEAFH